MATIAQGQLAGQLANGLVQLASFQTALQSCLSANAVVTQISFQTTLGQITFNPTGLSVADSATLFNTMVGLSNSLTTEWTNQLTAL